MKMISLVFRDDLVTVGLSLRSGIATSPVDTAQLWNTTADLFRFIQRWADEARADDWELFLVDLSFIQFLCRRIEAETGKLPEVIVEERVNTMVTILNGREEGQIVIGTRRLNAAADPVKRACLNVWRATCKDEGLTLTIRMKKDLSSAAAHFLAQHDIPTSRLATLTILALAQANPADLSSKRISLGLHAILTEIQRLYGMKYAENTRESIRRDVIAPMLRAGLLLLNPDEPKLQRHHPRTHYALTQAAFDDLCQALFQ